MSQTLATALWLCFLVGLFRLDPAKDCKVSPTLWVPITWMFITATRLPSQWLGDQTASMTAASLEEGNSTDRIVYFGLMLLALIILTSRSFNWARFFSLNPALTALICYALVSVAWSDFTLIAFKRWFRDLGNYLALLVVLSDPRPLDALRIMLRRLGYLFVPLSILLIKYYPQLGKRYEFWTGESHFVGATTSKNMLGVGCLVCGLFFFWDTVLRWRNRKSRRTKRVILVNAAFFGMTLWLLHLSSSATSTVCLVMGCAVILAANSKASRRNPRRLEILIPSGICLYLVLAFGLGIDINALVTGAVGRDSTFTGRTNIWHAVLSQHTNPLLGTGYESFWLGPRLERVWQLAGHYNEAHNGYLEVYLNLGIVGLMLLGWLLADSYRSICRRRTCYPPGYGSLALALWTIVLFYNVTEAAFKAQLIWIVFLLTAIVVPMPSIPTERRTEKRVLEEYDEAKPPEAITA